MARFLPLYVPPFAGVALAGLLCLALTGCGETPEPEFQPETDETVAWDGYVSRHLGRALGRLQFKVPPTWTVTYVHDTIHPRLVVANMADWKSPNVSYIEIGLTEVPAPNAPPAVWEAGNYAAIDPNLPKEEKERQKLLLDRKIVVDVNGRLGQGVTWQTTQANPPIGDWETEWKYGVDPGPGAVNRDKQRVNRFQAYLASHPGTPVDAYKEFFCMGWGTHRPRLAHLHVFYRARNEAVRKMLEKMIPTIQDFQFAESEVAFLGGVIKRAQWDALVEQHAAAAQAAAAAINPGVPASPSTQASPAAEPAQAARP